MLYDNFLFQTPFSALSQLAVSTCCFGCSRSFTEPRDSKVYKCPKCRRFFCCDCDIFMHETLHSCPGCAGSRQQQQQNGNGS